MEKKKLEGKYARLVLWHDMMYIDNKLESSTFNATVKENKNPFSAYHIDILYYFH